MSTSSTSSKKLPKLSASSRNDIGRPVKASPSNASLTENIELAINVIDVCKQKIKLAAVLPLYFQDDDLMKSIFSPTQVAKLRKLCDRYLQKCSETIKPEIDFRLLKAVELAHCNPKAIADLDARIKFLPQDLSQFLEAFLEVCNIFQNRFKTTAAMEAHQESVAYSLYHEIAQNKSAISSIKSQLQEREVSVQWKSAEKQALISKYNRDLSDRKWLNNIRIQKELVTANKKMNEICTQSEFHLTKLRDEADKMKQNYMTTLKENVDVYKKATEKKGRILAQLNAWIRKYDTDVGEKIRENAELKKQLAELTEKVDKFMEQFEQQEAIYLRVVSEKESEEKKAQEEKLMLFMMNRAAKIIQGAWRRYKSKKKKGKGKRGKKGKK